MLICFCFSSIQTIVLSILDIFQTNKIRVIGSSLEICCFSWLFQPMDRLQLFARPFLYWTLNEERSSGFSWRYAASSGSSSHGAGRSSFPAHFCAGLLIKLGHQVFLGNMLLLQALPVIEQVIALCQPISVLNSQSREVIKFFLGDLLFLLALLAIGQVAALCQPNSVLHSESREVIKSSLEICCFSWLF